MKKKIALLLAMVSLVGVMGGCGKTAKNDDSDIVWYMVGDPQSDLDSVMAEVSKKTKEKIGVGVKLILNSYSDHMTKMQTMIGAGEKFDLFFTAETDYAEYAKNGSIVDITDMMDTYGKDMEKAIPKNVFEQAYYNGKLYGIPTYKETAWQWAWIVNVPVAEKYGIDYKKDLKDLKDIEPILQKVKDGEGKDFKVLLDTIYPDTYFDKVKGADIFGVKFDPDNPTKIDNTIYNMYETDEQMEYFRTMRNYYNEGFVSTDVNVNRSEVMKTGNWFLTTVNYQPQYEISESMARGYDIDVVYRHTPIMNGTAGAINAIPVTCQRPEKVVEFLNLVNSDPEIRQTIGYGIEGVHWTKDDNGRRVITDKGKAGYSSISNYAIGNLFITGLSAGDREDKWEQFDVYNKSAVESPLLGFYFDNSSVKSELAAVTSVVSQYKKDLENGRIDPEEAMPKFLSELKKAGSDKIKEEVQKQYDEFLKKNK